MIVVECHCKQLGHLMEEYVFGKYDNLDDIKNDNVKQIAKNVIETHKAIKKGLWYVYLEEDND